MEARRKMTIRNGNMNLPSLPGWGKRSALGDQKLLTNYHKVSDQSTVRNVVQAVTVCE